MLKKKRFRRNTTGKINMFFSKYPYSGLNNYAYKFPSSLVSEIVDYHFITKVQHYINVTKKKVYYYNYEVC